jgi:hypothetical protein
MLRLVEESLFCKDVHTYLTSHREKGHLERKRILPKG